MLDVPAAAVRGQALRSSPRRRALLVLGALALAGHGLLIGSIGRGEAGASTLPPAAMQVRAVEAPPLPSQEAQAEPEGEAAAPAVAVVENVPAGVASTRPFEPPVATRPVAAAPSAASAPRVSSPQPVAAGADGSTSLGDALHAEPDAADRLAAAIVAVVAPAEPQGLDRSGVPGGTGMLRTVLAVEPSSPAASNAEAAGDASSTSPGGVAAGALVAAAAAPPTPRSALLPGDEPPPVYRTRLPPPTTLRYEVRRGLLQGTGEIRWQPAGDRYELRLEASIAGLTLLVQTSTGGLDGGGLAPLRFMDQRARRAAVAANFRRQAGVAGSTAASPDTITFSGSPAAFVLLPGSQDRLSWMIQLAAIAAAEPKLLVDGGRIAMVVAGGRGDAALWTFRYAGVELAETASGQVRAVKLQRDGRSAGDTSAEIWLDPERHFLPVHATLRSASGALEYDLLLERIVAAP